MSSRDGVEVESLHYKAYLREIFVKYEDEEKLLENDEKYYCKFEFPQYELENFKLILTKFSSKPNFNRGQNLVFRENFNSFAKTN